MTEKSYHTGIKTENLRREFEHFKTVPFPKKPISDELQDIFAELVEFDAYVAGLVTTILNGHEVEASLVSNLPALTKEFDEQMNALESKGIKVSKELQEYKRYKEIIDRLINLLLPVTKE